MALQLDNIIFQMTIHLTPGSFTNNKITINGQSYQYRCLDGVQMGDTVRVARVVGETLILEKVPSRGTDSEL
ncbi:NfeD family protein [Weissella cibaria]|uniref:NfeD family protein n=1 Tax=Weissella cibaria TaxID=137591 RepID=UPI00119300D6|nr:hypothetical protein [Weissella cibaria]MCC6121730.1 hypothetical protein [Weissella cibaria]MCS8561550.1 hypothetical protein [Weissella cibaria]MCS8564975.1 hypothetical protein [Weissella cibaria]MCS8575474.1 hypothetical protein [Weissella cibaria]MCS9999411.1 hypothetical protein [Weissella cibaria]